MALDLRLDGREFDPRPPQLILGWMSVFRQANHFSILPSHPGQLSPLPSVGQEMSTSHNAVMLGGWAVKAGMVHSIYVNKRVGGR